MAGKKERETSQLDDMLVRAYAADDFKRFVKLARRKLARLKKSKEEQQKEQKARGFAVIRQLRHR